MTVIKKELYFGNSKAFNMRVLDKHEHTGSEGDSCCIVEHYNAEYNDIKFTITTYSSRGGVDSADAFFNLADFKSKASLIRFYRDIKAMGVEVF